MTRCATRHHFAIADRHGGVDIHLHEPGMLGRLELIAERNEGLATGKAGRLLPFSLSVEESY
ncbi:MAG: hypothetical protein H6668_01385 [Ardenticatenaceae bacterium]|nr:hypothetical protein [Ardenticatenaceae bacterium]